MNEILPDIYDMKTHTNNNQPSDCAAVYVAKKNGRDICNSQQSRKLT